MSTLNRDETIATIATTTVLDYATARRCVEAMPNVPAVRQIRVAADASVLAQQSGMDPVTICGEFALALAAASGQVEQSIARLGGTSGHGWPLRLNVL